MFVPTDATGDRSQPTKSFDAGSQFNKLAAIKPDANAILPQLRSV